MNRSAGHGPPDYDPAGHDAVQALIGDFAADVGRVQVSEDFEDSLARVCAAAVTAVGGCRAASISLLTGEAPVTRGATDRLAERGDQLQYEHGEGPCLDASMEQSWVSTPDLKFDPRWPRSAALLVRELGVRSMFSCGLALDMKPDRTHGGLNLYALTPHAFSTQDQMLAVLLASLGSVVVDAARRQEQLRAAISTRQVIGESIGILRAQSNLTSDQAFTLLAQASQRTNIKLRDLAQQIADGALTGREALAAETG